MAHRHDETRNEALNRWEQSGWLDPDCNGCREFYETPEMPFDVHAPRHKPSDKCESGKEPHCCCDLCW